MVFCSESDKRVSMHRASLSDLGEGAPEGLVALHELVRSVATTANAEFERDWTMVAGAIDHRIVRVLGGGDLEFLQKGHCAHF